jgi:hypothetical protein
MRKKINDKKINFNLKKDTPLNSKTKATRVILANPQIMLTL